MKILIFSHIADCDGITPVILSKLAFEQVDYILLDNPLDEDFKKEIKNLNIKQYDAIFMTDLCLSKETINQLDEEFKNKFLIFDHHIANIEMNEYNFITVIDEQNGIKESGTSLYYQFLLNNYSNELLERDSTKSLVNFVRLVDTWTQKDEKEPVYLADFLAMIGNERFIDYFYNFIKNNKTFYFEDKLKYLFEIEEIRKKEYFEEKEKQIIPIKLKGYKIGVVFAENHRSSLGNYLASKYQQYDFIIIINVSRSVSYRGIKDINLSTFASNYGGKGHANAAGSPLPKGLKEAIIKQIFIDVEIENED